MGGSREYTFFFNFENTNRFNNFFFFFQKNILSRRYFFFLKRIYVNLIKNRCNNKKLDSGSKKKKKNYKHQFYDEMPPCLGRKSEVEIICN